MAWCFVSVVVLFFACLKAVGVGLGQALDSRAWMIARECKGALQFVLMTVSKRKTEFVMSIPFKDRTIY